MISLNISLLVMISTLSILLILIIIITPVLSNWFLYRKANEPGWASIIPVYSTLIWLKIIGKPWYWLLLFCVPYLNIIFLIWAINLTSKSFGKSEGYTFGLILLPLIFWPMLAFGSSKYIGPSVN
jgi:hypothetical protein